MIRTHGVTVAVTRGDSGGDKHTGGDSGGAKDTGGDNGVDTG